MSSLALTRILVILIALAIVAATTKLDPKSEVTLVITACNRPENLLELLTSFFLHVQYPLRAVIVSEASGDKQVNAAARALFPFITELVDRRKGQVDSIDDAYALVNSTYILHFEEDWIVTRGGFIEPSILILERHANVSVVSLHVPSVDNDYQQVDPCCELLGDRFSVGYVKKDPWLGWGYFSWGSGLRRLSDYVSLGSSYKRFDHTWKTNERLQIEAKQENIFVKKHFIHREWKINWLYKSKGFRVAMFNDSLPYAYHNKSTKHVPDQKSYSPFE